MVTSESTSGQSRHKRPTNRRTHRPAKRANSVSANAKLCNLSKSHRRPAMKKHTKKESSEHCANANSGSKPSNQPRPQSEQSELRPVNVHFTGSPWPRYIFLGAI